MTPILNITQYTGHLKITLAFFSDFTCMYISSPRYELHSTLCFRTTSEQTSLGYKNHHFVSPCPLARFQYPTSHMSHCLPFTFGKHGQSPVVGLHANTPALTVPSE